MDTAVYIDDIHRKEIPAGALRARRLGGLKLAGRAAAHLEDASA